MTVQVDECGERSARCSTGTLRSIVLACAVACAVTGPALAFMARTGAVPPPPGVPASDVALRDDLEAARRDLPSILEMLGPMPSAEGAAVKRIDPESADAKEIARRSARGAEALAQGKPLKAIPDFEAAVALDPADPNLLRSLAQAYAQVGNEGRAINTFERLLVVKPDDASALVATGAAAAANHRHPDAVRRIATALAVDRQADTPMPWQSRLLALRVLGSALRELEFDAAAIDCWSQALEILDNAEENAGNGPRPDGIRTRAELLLARADAATRIGQYERALADLDAIAALPGVDRDIVLPRTLHLLQLQGRGDEAERRLAESISTVKVLSDREVELVRWLVERSPDRPLLVGAAREAATGRAGSIAAARLLAQIDPRAGVDAFAAVLATTPEDTSALRGYFQSRAAGDADALATALVERLRIAPEWGMPAVLEALSTSVTERALREALARQPDSPARTAAQVRLALVARNFGPAWTMVTAAREASPSDLGLAIAQVETAGSLEEPALLAALERGTPGTAGGLPQDPAVERAVALAYRAVGDAVRAIERLERLHDQGVRHVSTALARLYAEQAAALRPDDSARQALGQRALGFAEGALAERPTDDDAALIVLRLRDPRAGAVGNAEEWMAFRQRLREGPLAWLDERVSIEEDIARGRIDQGMARLMALAESRPFDGEIIGLTVSLLARAGRAAEAAEWLDGRLARSPALLSLRDARIAAAAQSGQAEAMLDGVQKALESDPDDGLAAWHAEALLRAVGRVEEATDRSRDRLLLRPEGVRRSLELANLEQRAGQLADALAAIEPVVKADALSGPQRLAAVEIISRLPGSLPGRNETLVALAEPGLDAADADAVLYAAAASIAVLDDARGGSRDEENEAIERVRRFAQRAAATPAGSSSDLAASLRWRDAAQMFVDAGSPAAAAEFLRARLVDPTTLQDAARRALLSAVFASDAATRSRADRAIELFRSLRAKGVTPFEWIRGGAESEADGLMQLSSLFTVVGDREGSERILDEVLSVAPDHAMAMNNLAWSRAERGLVDARTIELAERAHAGLPSDASILDTLGWVRYLQGRLQDDSNAGELGALTLLRRAVESSKADPSLEVLDHLGDALWESGDRAGAEKSWREVVKIAKARYDRASSMQGIASYLANELALRVVDPDTFYEQHYGQPLERATRKLSDLEAGSTPTTARPLARSSGAEGAAHP